jgi:hypothetical protein
MQTKEQCIEGMSKDKLPKSSSRHNQRKDSEKMKPLKRSSRSYGGSRYGSSGNAIKVTVEEAITGPENASGDSTSPSLLPVASGRMARSKSKQNKSGNTKSKIIEHNLSVPWKGEFSELSTTESQHKPFLHSHGILESVKANRRSSGSSKSCKPLSIEESNDCGQVKIDENDSLPVCGKEKALSVEISKQNDEPSKASVRKGSEPSDLASSEAVVVEVCKRNMLDSAESLKVHVEMQETVQKPVSQTVLNDVASTSTNKEVRNVKMHQSTVCSSSSLKSNSEAQTGSVKFTEQNILDSSDALEVSPRKVQETNTEVSKKDIVDSLQQVHDEIPASGVKTSEPSTSNTSSCVEVGVQNESVPCLETSADTGTSKDGACNMVKEGNSDAVEQTTKATNSHASSKSLTPNVNSDKRDVKSVFSKIKNDPLIEETPKLEVRDEKEMSSGDPDSKSFTRCRKSAPKLTSSVSLLGSDGMEVNKDKPADILGCQTACNLKMDRLLAPGGLSAERNELHVTEVEHGERKRSNARHNPSVVPTEDPCPKTRKRKLRGTEFENDLNTVQISSQRSESSHIHQSSSGATVIEDNLVSLLKEGRKNSSTRNPEIRASSIRTATTEELTISDVTRTSPVLTFTEASAVTTPILAAIVTADSPSEINILPSTVEKETEPVPSCGNQTTKGDISEKLNADMNSICKEENSPVEKVVRRQRARYSAVNKDKSAPRVMPRKLRSSTHKVIKQIQDRTVNKKCQISDHPRELDDQTSVVVSEVAALPRKHVAEKDRMSKLDLKTTSGSEERTFCLSKSEVTLSCAEISGATTGLAGSQKAADSEEIIESSQDSSVSSFIVSRFPLIHKCSVSVRRINTTLEPGAKIDVSQSDQELMVLVPRDPNSSFKVYTPDKRTSTAVQEEKSAKADSEMEKAHCSKSEDNATRFNKEDTSKPRPKPQIYASVPEDSVSAVSPEDAPKLRLKKQVNASKSEDIILKVCRKDALKTRSMQQINASISEINISTVSSKETPKLRSKQQINASISESNISAVCSKDTLKGQSKQQINVSKSDDSVSAEEKEGSKKPQPKQQSTASYSKRNVSSAVKEDTQKPQSKQEINTSNSDNGILMSVNEDASKPKPKQSISASKCDNNTLSALKEDIPKPRSKQKKSEDCILTAIKECTLKPRTKQISIPESEVISLVDVTESRLKHRVHTSRLNSAIECDIRKSQPKQQVDITKAEVRNISVMENDASEPELNFSDCEEHITICVIEDTTELRSEQTGMNKKMNQESEGKNVNDIQGMKVVLRLSSEKVLNKEEPVEVKTQQSVKPKSISMNHCEGRRTRRGKKNVPKLDDKTSSADDSSLTLQKVSDKSHCIDNAADITKAPELKETSISKGESKLSLPLQSRKRPADSSPALLEVHHGEVDSRLDYHIDTGASKVKRLSQNAENVRDCSPMSSPSRAKFCNDRDSDKTLSSKSVRSSPSSMLRAFSSPLGSLELNQKDRSHHRHPSGGRAQYLVGLAVAANDMESLQTLSPVSPQKPKEARSIIAASPPSSPQPRKKLVCGVSDGDCESGASVLERQVPFAYV